MGFWGTASIAPAVALLAVAIITRPDTPSGTHVQRGAAAEFAAIVPILSDSGRLAGTGTIIDGSWVLTAAHVARVRHVGPLRVVVGADTLVVADTVVHPGAHDSIGALNRLDVALLRLQRAASVQAMALSARAAGVGDTVSIVGFGVGGPTADASGIRRWAQNTIDQVGALPTASAPPFALLMDFDVAGRPDLNRIGATVPLEFEGIQSAGDSGGPVLRRSGTEWRIVGVYYRTGYNVGGMLLTPRQFGGALSQSVSVTAFRDWVNQVIHP